MEFNRRLNVNIYVRAMLFCALLLVSGCINSGKGWSHSIDVLRNVSGSVTLRAISTKGDNVEPWPDYDVAIGDEVEWDFGDGIILRTREQTVEHDYIESGDYRVSATLLEEGRPLRGFATALITVNVPVAAVSMLSVDL